MWNHIYGLILILSYVPQAFVSFAQEFTAEDLQDPAILHMLRSFRYVRCAYQHFEVPSHHYLHALRALDYTLKW